MKNCHIKKKISNNRLIENLLNYNFSRAFVHHFWSDEQWDISWKKYGRKLARPLSRHLSAVRQSTKQNDRTGSLWLTHITRTFWTWSRNAKHPTVPFGKMMPREISSNMKTFTLQSPKSNVKDEVPKICTWCGRKVMRLATLCMNRQRCCLPLHMAVRWTPAIDSVQVWTHLRGQ
jgi:hypothetical protein